MLSIRLIQLRSRYVILGFSNGQLKLQFGQYGLLPYRHIGCQPDKPNNREERRGKQKPTWTVNTRAATAGRRGPPSATES